MNDARLYNLDFLRGLAAFLVLSGHLRSFVFRSFAELEERAGLFLRAFYFVTGLGHQAVIIFFALSGFLVGGKAIEDLTNERFSWARYLLRRLTRLWIVIIPAMALTLLFDYLGEMATGGIGYDGRYYDLYASGPQEPYGIDLSFSTFAGNLAFLQTIQVPTFGSNGPMWSLANEFWYYVIFPLTAWIALPRIRLLGKITAFCILLLLASRVLPIWLLEGGGIWLAGAVAAWITRSPRLHTVLRHVATRIGAVTLLILALVSSKIPSLKIGDLELGLSVAVSLPILATLPSPGVFYRAIARASSEISYTLYLTHFPLLTLIVFSGFAPSRQPLGFWGAGIYVLLLVVALLWSAAVWWCFERNTNRVYSLIIAGMWVAPTPSRTRF